MDQQPAGVAPGTSRGLVKQLTGTAAFNRLSAFNVAAEYKQEFSLEHNDKNGVPASTYISATQAELAQTHITVTAESSILPIWSCGTKDDHAPLGALDRTDWLIVCRGADWSNAG